MPLSIDDVHARLAAGRPPTDSAAAVMEFVEAAGKSPVIRSDGNAIVLDLSVGSMALGEPLSGLSVERFSALIERAQARSETKFAFGRWGEPRDVYVSELFAEEGVSEMRNVHMGVDVFCAVGTPIYAPLPGVVHIKANNRQHLDYGPLLVLEHKTTEGEPFFTLYGHLDMSRWGSLSEGQAVSAGEHIADVGAPPDNGDWPPHLHFQLVLDLLDYGKDFPGVAYPSQRVLWLSLSPSPAGFFPEVAASALDASEDGGRDL